MNGTRARRLRHSAVAIATACMLAGGSRTQAQDEPEYIDFGIGGVAGYNSFADIVATSRLADETTVDGLVLQAEDGSRAVLALDVVVGPRGLVDGMVVATVDDGDPETDDATTVDIPVAGRTQWRSRTLVSPVPPAEGEEPVVPPPTVATTFRDNAFTIVARPAEDVEGENAAPRLRLAGRERYSETTAPAPAVYNGGFRTAMALELPDGRRFLGFALVDGLGTAHANFLVSAESFHSVDEGGKRWVGDAQVNTTWQDTYVPGGITRMELVTNPVRPRPEGEFVGIGGRERIQPPPDFRPARGRYHIGQTNRAYRGRVGGELVLPVLEEGQTPPPPIELQRIPRSFLFATPSAITTVEHVFRRPGGPS